MRYEVKLMNENLTGENKTVLETENRKEAFKKLSEVKKNERDYEAYDDVRLYENGVWIANVKLY